MSDYWHVWCKINDIWTYTGVSGKQDLCVKWVLGRTSLLEHVCINDFHNAKTHDDIKKLYDAAKSKSKPLKQKEFQWD